MKMRRKAEMAKKVDKSSNKIEASQNENSSVSEDEKYTEININSFQKNFTVLISHYKHVGPNSRSH